MEIDETIYGRAATHPKGRGPFGSKLTNTAHKNAILSLVERGGSVRSYHVGGSTVNEVTPVVNANVSHEAQIMTDSAQLYRYRLGEFASHDRIDHSKKEHARYPEGRPVVHTNTVEGYFSLFKRGVYQHCKEKHLLRYLAEFDHRYNNRTGIGVSDEQRAVGMVKGAKGKRLTYRATGGTRSEPGGEQAPPF